MECLFFCGVAAKRFLCNFCIFINIAFFALSDKNFYKKVKNSAIFSKI